MADFSGGLKTGGRKAHELDARSLVWPGVGALKRAGDPHR